MEEKEVKNEVPAPETDRKKEEKEKRNLPRNRYSNERRCWFIRLWDWYS